MSQSGRVLPTLDCDTLADKHRDTASTFRQQGGAQRQTVGSRDLPAGWGWRFPRGAGWGAIEFSMSLETRENKLSGGAPRQNCWDIPGVLKKFKTKSPCSLVGT